MRRFLQSAAAIALAAVVLSQTAGCARANRYDNLKALPLEEVKPVVVRQEADQAPRLGIAFGGGGVRGFVHLGVLRALEEAGIRADVVAGTSVGALAATLYASGMSAGEIESLAKSTSRYELLDLVFSREGAINGQAYAAWIRAVTGNRTMRELPVPLGITVTDLGAGKALLIVDGDPGEAVQASATVPGTVIPGAIEWPNLCQRRRADHRPGSLRQGHGRGRHHRGQHLLRQASGAAWQCRRYGTQDFAAAKLPAQQCRDCRGRHPDPTRVRAGQSGQPRPA